MLRAGHTGVARWGERWQHAVETAKQPKGTRFHEGRHYYASVLIDAGESALVIKERLGHASIRETFDTYGHLFPTSDDRTREATDRALACLAASSRPGFSASAL